MAVTPAVGESALDRRDFDLELDRCFFFGFRSPAAASPEAGGLGELAAAASPFPGGSASIASFDTFTTFWQMLSRAAQSFLHSLLLSRCRFEAKTSAELAQSIAASSSLDRRQAQPSGAQPLSYRCRRL